jgi:hypothetical protein
MDWYYSKSLDLYISLTPLKISPTVFNIAKENDIELEWDDYGNICNIDFDIYTNDKTIKLKYKNEYDSDYVEVYSDDNFIE